MTQEREALPLWRVMDMAAYPQPQPPGHNYRAAELRALRDWLVPDEAQPQQSAMPFSDWNLKIEVWDDHQRLRALLTAEAERAEKGE